MWAALVRETRCRLLFLFFDKGRAGEAAAGIYLSGLGMSIIDRNFRTPYGEIDIIAQDGPVLVFVEVKTRKAFPASIFSPWEDISEGKTAKIERAGRIYMRRGRRKLRARRARFFRIDGLVIEAHEDGGCLFEYRRGLSATSPVPAEKARAA